MQISVIIPHYNLPEWLLRRCLDSLFMQSADDFSFEVIVVDDGSQHSPAPLIDSYRRDNLRLIVQPHKRLGAARNTGLNQAQGKYILFVDGDDYLYPGTLATLLSMAEEHQCDILNFAYRPCHSQAADPVVQPAVITCTPPCSGNDFMWRQPLYGTVWHYLFRRELCDTHQLRFAEQVFIEDEVFTTLLHCHALRVSRTNLTVYAYYQRPGSITSDQRPERQRELISCHLSALRQLTAHYRQTDPSQPAEGLHQKIATLALDFIRRLLRESDWQRLWKAHRPSLEQMNLYPLTVPRYGWKYTLYARLANHSWGLHLLHLAERRNS